MLDKWAEADTFERNTLWQNVHEAGDAFEDVLRYWRIPRL